MIRENEEQKVHKRMTRQSGHDIMSPDIISVPIRVCSKDRQLPKRIVHNRRRHRMSKT